MIKLKIKTNFTTNSSSSSFVIHKKDLTSEQLKIIFNPQEKAEELNLCGYDDPNSWIVKSTKYLVYGYTTMDNFDWIKFLKLIGVKNFESEAPHSGGNGFEILDKYNLNPYKEEITDEN